MRSYHPAKILKIWIFYCAQWKNSNFRNFCWMIRTQPISLLKLFLLYIPSIKVRFFEKYIWKVFFFGLEKAKYFFWNKSVISTHSAWINVVLYLGSRPKEGIAYFILYYIFYRMKLTFCDIHWRLCNQIQIPGDWSNSTLLFSFASGKNCLNSFRRSSWS